MKLTRRSRAGSARTRSIEAREAASFSESGAATTGVQQSSIWAINFMSDILTPVDVSVNVSTVIDGRESRK